MLPHGPRRPSSLPWRPPRTRKAALTALLVGSCSLVLLALLQGSQQKDTGTSLRRLSEAPPEKLWLLIGVPTVSRGLDGKASYLADAVGSLAEELPGDPTDPLYGKLKVLVMDNAAPSGAPNPEFQRLKALAQQHASAGALAPGAFQTGGGGSSSSAGGAYDGSAEAPWLFGRLAVHAEWVDNPGNLQDPASNLPDPDDLNNPEDRPGRQVRKQTADLVALIREAQGRAHYFLFMEDDFEVCPHMLRALQYTVAKANALSRLQDWAALRISYGMNGIVLKDADLPALADFLWRHIAVKPPDLLFREWALRQVPTRTPADLRQPLPPPEHRRPYVVYKHNMLSHIGNVSSFAVRPPRKAWPSCFAPMASAWSLHTSERFHPSCNSVDDLSPCTTPAAAQVLQQPMALEARHERWLGLPLTWDTVGAAATG